MTNDEHVTPGDGAGASRPGSGRPAAPSAGAGAAPPTPGPARPGPTGPDLGPDVGDEAPQTGTEAGPGFVPGGSSTSDSGTNASPSDLDSSAGAGPGSGGGATAVGRDPEGAAGGDGAQRFRRDRGNKVIGGVCAGLGRHCDMDPVIFRITLGVLSATGGLGLIFYGFAWLFVPYEAEEENEVRKLLTGRVDGQALAGVIFALVGCGVFLTMLENTDVLSFGIVLSVLLAGAGYWSRRRGAPDADPLAAQAAADAPPEPKAPPAPAGSYPSWWRDPITKDGTHVGGTGYLWGPRDTRDRDVAAAINISLGTSRPRPGDIRTESGGRADGPRRRGARWIGGWIFLLALAAGSITTTATWDSHSLGTSLEAGLSSTLLVYGLGIAVSAFLGRTGGGTIFMALVIAALLAASAAVPRDIGTGWSRPQWRPTEISEVKPRYELSNGAATLDLSRLHLPKNRTLPVVAEVSLGRLHVIVPDDVTVRADIKVGVGDIQLPGDKKQDIDVAPDKKREVVLRPLDKGKAGGTLDLTLQVGAGQAEVSHGAS